MIYETTEPYDGSGKDGYLTLPKGCQVEVLDRSGDDWLVCTVPEKEDEMEKEGVVPKSILTPLTRPGEIVETGLLLNVLDKVCDVQASALTA